MTVRTVAIDDLRVRCLDMHIPGQEQPADAVPLPGVSGVFVDPEPFVGSKVHFAAPNEACLQAYADGARIGHITWGISYFWGNVHEPSTLRVDPAFTRRGIATALWREAQRHDPALEHSEVRTDDGDAWARSTGDPLPKYRFKAEEERVRFFREHPEAMEDA